MVEPKDTKLLDFCHHMYKATNVQQDNTTTTDQARPPPLNIGERGELLRRA